MQQVNLYLPELRPTKEWLTAKTFAISLGGMLLLFTLAVVVQSKNLKEFELQVEFLEAQQVSAVERLNKFKDRAGNPDADRLNNKVSQLQRDIQQRHAVKDFFLRQNLGNEAGFSSRLDSLSKVTPRSASLSTIRFYNGEKDVSIYGQTRKPNDVAVLLSILKAEESFNMAHIGSLSLVETKSNKNIHDFAVGAGALFDDIESVRAEK